DDDHRGWRNSLQSRSVSRDSCGPDREEARKDECRYEPEQNREPASRKIESREKWDAFAVTETVLYRVFCQEDQADGNPKPTRACHDVDKNFRSEYPAIGRIAAKLDDPNAGDQHENEDTAPQLGPKRLSASKSNIESRSEWNQRHRLFKPWRYS